MCTCILRLRTDVTGSKQVPLTSRGRRRVCFLPPVDAATAHPQALQSSIRWRQRVPSCRWQRLTIAERLWFYH